jgi:hypothetical protein
MARSPAPDQKPENLDTNRALVLILVSLVVCVLAVGAWRLLGQKPPPSPTEPGSISSRRT